MQPELAPSLVDQLLDLVQTHIALVEPIVFALGFAESIAFVSLLVPSTLLFLAIGGLHSAAGGEFLAVWIAGGAGACLGDMISYGFGRAYKHKVSGLWPFSSYPHWYDRARDLCRDWGVAGVIGGKFLGMARPFVPVVAGAMHMALPLFVVASLLSSLLWAGVFLAPGYGISWALN